MRPGAAARLGAMLAVAAIGCGAPPWRMGAPLDGRPAIPPGQARRSVDELRAEAAGAGAAGRTVLELAALSSLDAVGRLQGAEKARLVELLLARAEAFQALGRAIPESGDLEAMARLEPARGAKLTTRRAAAAAAAGDAWKAIGAPLEARNAYARAAWLGGAPASSFPSAPVEAPRGKVLRLATPLPASPPEITGWVLAGPALSARLLPLVAAFPWVLDDVPRALAWADLLLGEDPTSPDVLELVAFIFGRARRFGGTERMLMELAYYSPDRAAGLARGAVVWERLGRGREACAQWIRAARWRDDPEDPAWPQAFACAHRDPGAGDWREIRDYVLGRARAERRASLAAALDAAAGIRPASAPVAGRHGDPDGGAAAEAGVDAGRDGADVERAR